jgi:hypothetical protein
MLWRTPWQTGFDEMRLALVGVLLVGLCTACGGAQADQQSGDVYREFIPACDILPDDTVAAVTKNLPPAAEPAPPQPDTDTSSTCRRDFFHDKFSVWVSLQAIRFPAKDGKSGVDRARYWLLSYGTDIASAPAPEIDDTPAPPSLTPTAKDLGYEKVSLGNHWGSTTLYGVDGNAGVVVEYGYAPKASATEDDFPPDLDWAMREATFQLAKDIAAGLHEYRSE